MAGQFAARVKPALLIITHFSQRYTGNMLLHYIAYREGPGVSPNVSDLLQQAREACVPIKVEAANDFSVFEFLPKWKKSKNKS
jgi:ribonuclease BN (tRNA processing enzyme)